MASMVTLTRGHRQKENVVGLIPCIIVPDEMADSIGIGLVWFRK